MDPVKAEKSFLETVQLCWEFLSFFIFPLKFLALWFSHRTLNFVGITISNTSTWGSEAGRFIEEIMGDLTARSLLDENNNLYKLSWKEGIALTIIELVMTPFIWILDGVFVSIILWSVFLGPVILYLVPIMYMRDILEALIKFVLGFDTKITNGYIRKIFAKRYLADKGLSQRVLKAYGKPLSLGNIFLPVAFVDGAYLVALNKIGDCSKLDPSPGIKAFEGLRDKYFSLENKLDITLIAKEFIAQSTSTDTSRGHF